MSGPDYSGGYTEVECEEHIGKLLPLADAKLAIRVMPDGNIRFWVCRGDAGDEEVLFKGTSHAELLGDLMAKAGQ